MRNLALQAVTEKLDADGRITAEEALELRKTVFPDGVVSRDEAEVLIALEARVANTDEAWADAFVEALVDHVLQSGAYPGHIDEATVAWLRVRFGQEGGRPTEVEALLKMLERSQSAPDSLSDFARERVSAALADKPVGDAEAELVRRVLYASSGDGATSVTEAEARWLFQVDAQSDGFANAPAWRDLFVKAVLNHLMGRRAPDLLEQHNMLARQAWFARPQGAPGSSLATMFDGGLGGFIGKLKQANVLDGLEARYEQMNADAAQDEKLTLAEIAWAVGMTKADGKRTTNEEALLAAIRELEAAAVP